MRQHCRAECANIAAPIGHTLIERCHAPNTPQTYRTVMQHSPMYGYLLSISSMVPKHIPVYLEAMQQSVDCVSNEQWMTNFKATVESDDFMNQLLASSLPYEGTL